jgi:hypothetical protein
LTPPTSEGSEGFSNSQSSSASDTHANSAEASTNEPSGGHASARLERLRAQNLAAQRRRERDVEQQAPSVSISSAPPRAMTVLDRARAMGTRESVGRRRMTKKKGALIPKRAMTLDDMKALALECVTFWSLCDVSRLRFFRIGARFGLQAVLVSGLFPRVWSDLAWAHSPRLVGLSQ